VKPARWALSSISSVVIVAAEGGLGLVEDQKGAAVASGLAEFREVALRWNDDAAGADDRFGNDSGGSAGRLHVEHLQADPEAGHVAFVATVLDRAAVGIGLGDDIGPGSFRAGALAVAGEGYSARLAGHAMPRAAERQDLPAAGGELRHFQSGLVRLGARVDKKLPLQGRRQPASQLLGKAGHRLGNHPGEHVDRAVGAVLDRGHDRGVVVADGCAHLARGEIEDLTALVVDDRGALRRNEQGRERVAAVADQQLIGRFAQFRIGHVGSIRRR
jgi:hypothetical protein